MSSAVKNYLGMIAITIVVVLIVGTIAVRIDQSQEIDPPAGVSATPAITGNAPDGLVDVRWLAQYGSQVDYIFDLSDLNVYEAGHIPGAQHIWWQDAMRLHSANYGEADQISQESGPVWRILNLDVPQNSRIILYDANDSERASWLLWVMSINGYTDVHVLDGGLPAWIGNGGELTTDAPEGRDTSVVATPTWDESFEIRREPLRDKLDDPNLRLIDARSSEEQSETVNSTVREGHIPGSINIPTAEVMREDGTFKSPQELQDLFASYGIEPDNDVVVYSLFTTGSGNVWMALQIAGFDNAVIYQEGYVAWGHKSMDLPIEADPYPTAIPEATPDLATPDVSTPPDATVESSPEPSPTEGPTDLTGEE